MKFLVLIGFIFSTQMAMAVSVQCESTANAVKTASYISSWPEITAMLEQSHCANHPDGSSSCYGISENVSNSASVCYRAFDTFQECTIQETTPYLNAANISVYCSKGSILSVQMDFVMDANLNGKLSCTEKGTLRQTWDLGNCHITQ